MYISASVVESGGRKANWSAKVRLGNSAWNAGYRNCCAVVLSIIPVSIGVMEIGLKSLCVHGSDTFGTGQIYARFHCV